MSISRMKFTNKLDVEYSGYLPYNNTIYHATKIHLKRFYQENTCNNHLNKVTYVWLQ